jgi:hypothetical protein
MRWSRSPGSRGSATRAWSRTRKRAHRSYERMVEEGAAVLVTDIQVEAGSGLSHR